MGVLNMGMGLLCLTWKTMNHRKNCLRQTSKSDAWNPKKNSKWLINSTRENVRRPQVRLFLASSSSGTCSKPRCGRLGMVPGNRPTAPLRSRPLKSLGQWSGGRDISVISLGHPLADPYILLFFFVFYSCPSPSWVSPSWPILDTLQTKTSLESRLSHF